MRLIGYVGRMSAPLSRYVQNVGNVYCVWDVCCGAENVSLCSSLVIWVIAVN